MSLASFVMASFSPRCEIRQLAVFVYPGGIKTAIARHARRGAGVSEVEWEAGLRAYDRFLVCADFDSYWDAQMRVEAHWHDTNAWWRSAVLNTARMGWFSSDRTIREYATDIWKALE